MEHNYTSPNYRTYNLNTQYNKLQDVVNVIKDTQFQVKATTQTYKRFCIHKQLNMLALLWHTCGIFINNGVIKKHPDQ